jgi:hypothetical protein
VQLDTEGEYDWVGINLAEAIYRLAESLDEEAEAERCSKTTREKLCTPALHVGESPKTSWRAIQRGRLEDAGVNS